jgi:hypothetical protein
MNGADEPTKSGCYICGTVISPDDWGFGYLRLEDDNTIFANVCSWLCAMQFCVLKAAEQRNRLQARNEELRRKNKDLEYDSYLLPYYQAGVL